MGAELISLIVPVFNEEEVIAESYRRMSAVMQGLNHPYEIIYVDDGSADNTLELLKDLCTQDKNVKILSFSRNFGHQLAVTAGIDAANGDALVIIDADLQDPPEVIPELIEKWKHGYDVVYAKRTKREGEGFFKKFTAAVYYRLLGAMSGQSVPLDSGDFRLIGRNVADALRAMPEHSRFLRGMSAWAGFKQAPLEYIRHERFAGRTKYSMKKMLKLASDGITGFSTRPLTIWLAIGIILCDISLLGTLALLILAATSVAFAPWLWALCGVILLNGLVLCAAGTMGLYLGRMYDELKRRPLYILKERVNFTKGDIQTK